MSSALSFSPKLSFYARASTQAFATLRASSATSSDAQANHNSYFMLDDDLVSRRRLGQTNLQVRQSQVGTSNATKPENLGLIEYAHLRAPLPKDLRGSEVHKSHSKNAFPDTYFLMVCICRI